jgi:molybdopterin-containing oxidoreductase family membrane subunit
VVEYVPTLTEWKITAGIWAVGLMVLTVAVKVALPVLSGQIAASHTAPGKTGHGDKAMETQEAA